MAQTDSNAFCVHVQLIRKHQSALSKLQQVCPADSEDSFSGLVLEHSYKQLQTPI